MNINGCKIWLTGSRGFIGSNLASELDNSCDLTCLSNTKNEDIHSNQTNKQPVYVDFQNKKNIIDIIERLGIPDIFIHLGWGDMTNPHSEVHLVENINQSKNLIQVLYKAGLEKFVFLGSINEYGDQVGPLYEEMGPKGEITNYAKGKIEVAKFGFEKDKEMKKKFIHIRLSYTYGPVLRKGSLIQDLYWAKKKNLEISLGHCEHYRDYIHVSDALTGIKLLCNVKESTTVNLGSGKAIKLKEFVKLFWKILDGNPEKLHFGKKKPKKEQPQPNCFANLDKLEKITGWKPSIDLEEGIRNTVRELDNKYS